VVLIVYVIFSSYFKILKKNLLNCYVEILVSWFNMDIFHVNRYGK